MEDHYKYLKISSSCRLVFSEWYSKEHPVCLEYIEHSPDSWYSDTETSIDIDKEMAQNIVQFLKKHFEI